MRAAVKRVDQTLHSDADIRASLHVFIEALLVPGIKTRPDPRLSWYLCFAGVSVLNLSMRRFFSEGMLYTLSGIKGCPR